MGVVYKLELLDAVLLTLALDKNPKEKNYYNNLL